jgi:hypothetical protein
MAMSAFSAALITRLLQRGLMVRDARLRPAGQGGLLTMRVLDLILKVPDVILNIPELIQSSQTSS